jgi:phospholipid/cholesterol/gamma-HCH transport system ATP-binding protein
MTESVAIEVRGLRKAFGDNVVLDGVDLDVRCGETLVILGGSGSGKSTLLRCMVGLERPDEGTVHLYGRNMFTSDPRRLKKLRRKIGMAFQSGALFGSMTVGQNVELPLLEFTDLPATTRRIVVRLKLGMVGLEDAMDLYPSELSGGMIKRAALARALALDPDVVFFDEPSAGLDPITGAAIDRLLRQIQQIFESTFVIVTHEMISAFTIADRVALMHRGRFRIVDRPDVVSECDDPVVRDFLDRRAPESLASADKLKRFIEELKV